MNRMRLAALPQWNRVPRNLKLLSVSGLTLVAMLLIAPLASATHGPAPIPWAGAPNPVVPRPGLGLPSPQQVTGKDFSDSRDRDFRGAPNTEQVVAWDGVGGVRDSFNYDHGGMALPHSRTGYGMVDFPIEVDAIANGGDALFQAVRDDQAALLFSVQGDPNIHFVRATGFPGATPGHGIWATAADIDPVHPPMDVDGLEVWGPDQLDDTDRYSLRDDPFAEVSPDVFRKVAIWEYNRAAHTSDPHTFTADLAAAMDMQFGGPGFGGPLFSLLIEIMDVDAIMTLGAQVTYSIAPIDLTQAGLPAGFPTIFHGGEIFEYDGPGTATRYLEMGGHVWDHNFDVMGTFGLASHNINALEAVAIPEPSTVALLLLALLAATRFVRQR